MSIIYDGLKKDMINLDNFIFNSQHKKYTMYSSEFKKIIISKIFNYDQNISFTINLNGDLLHRCFFEIDIPILNLTDNIITNNDYKILKSNKLNNLENEIDYYTEEYNNFYNFSNIQLIVYSEIIKLFELKNITLEYLQSTVNSVVNNYSDVIVEYKLLVDESIISHVDITSYITNLSELNINIVLNEIKKKYTNIINYLEYYHSNKVYFQKEFDKINEGKLFYKWVDNLAHHYFNNFEFDIDGVIVDNYSNDFLHIYQSHNIKKESKDSYNKLIGNSDDIYINKGVPNYIYTPLLFWFCKDISLSLPLVGLMNSKLNINTRTNKLDNLIYFQDWENYYNDIITLYIPRKKHIIDDDKNIVSNYDLNYNSVEILIPENIYVYKCKRIDKKVLDYKFSGIDSDSILNNYGSEDSDGKYLSLDDFIYLMNNLKTDTLLSNNTKILIGDYHYFIDYNYLLNLVPKPTVNLIAEYCYVDDVERKFLATNKLQYITETHDEIILDINKTSIYDTINELNGLVKDIYYFSQLKLNTDGKSRYGESELNNYKNKYIESVELKLSNDYNTLEYNDFNPYYLLLSQLPEGVKLTTFSLNPNEIQPSGSVNMSCIDGKNIEVLVNDEYLSEYYNNKNNPNNSGSIFKIIYTKYNQLIVDKGKGAFKYY
tara:strand:+ start:1513 stop:3486 length:1974 start_codon:yes stop_codon:yes gene_type:complete